MPAEQRRQYNPSIVGLLFFGQEPAQAVAGRQVRLLQELSGAGGSLKVLRNN
jgi:hypothetical protein